MNLTEHVILVDNNDVPIGTLEKLKAHQEGLLHRAFSIFIFSMNNGEWALLLQQRHAEKYHSSNLWTNTCCSHPRPHETTSAAATRRLDEEMGLRNVPLSYAGHFIYHAKVCNELVEHEYDHVFVGIIDKEKDEFIPNPREVADWEWKKLSVLEDELKSDPNKYTAWFQEAYLIAKACTS